MNRKCFVNEIETNFKLINGYIYSYFLMQYIYNLAWTNIFYDHEYIKQNL